MDVATGSSDNCYTQALIWNNNNSNQSVVLFDKTGKLILYSFE